MFLNAQSVSIKGVSFLFSAICSLMFPSFHLFGTKVRQFPRTAKAHSYQSIILEGVKSAACQISLCLNNNATERFENSLNDRLPSKDLLFMLFYGSTISSVVYLRCRMQIQAKPMNRKRFWSCLLSNGGRKLVQMRAEASLLELCRVQPSFCKLLQTVYRLTFSYSK